MTFPLKKSKTKMPAGENLSARVYSQIKPLILCDEIMPGQKLYNQKLSERRGVSRTPARQALTRPVWEGYVSFLPNRVFTCKEIRLQEAEELSELRESLEAFAIDKLEKLTDCSLEELRQRTDLYGQDAQNRFTRERQVYDPDVHLRITQIAGNETLKSTSSHVFERIVFERRTDGIDDPGRGLAAHQEHVELLDAPAAVAVMRGHNQAAKKNFLADLRQRQEIRELRPVEFI